MPGENTIAVMVTAEDGAPSQTYTIKLVRAAPKSANASLAGLSVSNCGTVSLSFSGETAAYGPFTQGYNVASFTVTAEKAESAQTVTIDGTAGLSKTGNLVVGPNTITIEVTAENGVAKKKYTITIVREASEADPPTDSSDITGGSITGADGSTVSFDNPIAPDTHHYTGTVENGTTAVSLDGLTTNPGATTTITVNGETWTGDITQIPLKEGDNVIIVVVHGEDGYDQTYEFIIRRKTSTADLAGLTVIWAGADDNRITFDPTQTAYDLTSEPLDYAVASCTVMTIANNEYQTITINGKAASSKSIALAIGSSTATVSVIAEDGVTKKDYTVTLFRNGSNAPANIELICDNVNMIYDASKLEYSFTTASDAAAAKIMVAAKDPSQTIVVSANGKALAESPGNFALGYGINIIEVKVNSPGVSEATYTIRITRPDTPDSVDATLRSIDMTGIVFIPRFDRNTTSYTAEVGNSVASTDVLPVAYCAASTITVNGTAVTSTAGTVALEVGENTITIDVTAQNPAYRKTYTVKVYRANGTQNNNSALSGIGISPGEAALGTLFSPSVLAYSANVAYDISRVSISPQRAENTQTVEVDGISVDYNSSNVSVAKNLEVGTNTVLITVTAEDGVSSRTYTLTISRAAQGTSNNANLSSLVLTNPSTDLVPSFSANCLEYKAFVDKSATSVDFAPAAADAAASVTVNLLPSTAGSAQRISLGAEGSDTIVKVTVTAQDGTTRSYTVIVNRATEAWSNNAKLSSLGLSSGTLLPAFDSRQLEYVAIVDPSVSSLTIHAAQSVTGGNAKLRYNGNTSSTIALGYGRNLIEVKSVAQDGTASMTYTVQVYRREAGVTVYFNMPKTWKGASNRSFISYTVGSSSYTTAMTQLDDARYWWSCTIDAAASALKFQNSYSSADKSVSAGLLDSSKPYYACSSQDAEAPSWYWTAAKPSAVPSIAVSASPRPEKEGYAIPFKDTKEITLNAGGANLEFCKYTLDGSDPSLSGNAAASYFVNNMKLIIGQNVAVGTVIKVQLYGSNSAGTVTAAAAYTYEKTGKGMTVHFKRPSAWSGSPVIHQWVVNDAGVNLWNITGWKLAPEMAAEGSGWYSYTVDGLEKCGVLFMESNTVADGSPNITVDQAVTSSSNWFILNGGTGSGGGHSNRATGVWYSSQSAADTASASFTNLY